MEVNHEIQTDAVSYRQSSFFSGSLHWNENLELCALTEGRAQFRVGNETYDFLPGDLVIIPARELHMLTTFAPVRMHICLLPPRRLSLLGSNLPFLPAHIANERIAAIPGLRSSIDRCFEILQEDTEKEQAYSENILLLDILRLWFLLARHFAVQSAGTSRHRMLLQPLLDEMAGDCTRPYTLAYAAGRLNYTPEYFSAIFRASMGIGFKEYLNELRIKEAQRRMLVGGQSITEIALSVGFDSIRTFDHRFKAVTGQTARDYIRQFVK